MMRRVWLAVVLGIIIGIAVTPHPAGSQEKTMLQLTGAAQPARFETTSQQADPLQYLLIGLLAAIVLATPVFVLSRRRFAR